MTNDEIVKNLEALVRKMYARANDENDSAYNSLKDKALVNESARQRNFERKMGKSIGMTKAAAWLQAEVERIRRASY